MWINSVIPRNWLQLASLAPRSGGIVNLLCSSEFAAAAGYMDFTSAKLCSLKKKPKVDAAEPPEMWLLLLKFWQDLVLANLSEKR